MKPIYFILTFMFFLSVTNSSFVCFKFSKSVTIDSIHFFNSNQIILTAYDFEDTTIELKLYDGDYTFSKDTSKGYPLFKADKYIKNIYLLMNISPRSINDTGILATIKYQAFDKKKQTNSSRVFKLNDVCFPLKKIKSFRVSYEDYDKVFADKKKNSTQQKYLQ